MKTSKKILSLFLAVLMVVTTCSVGFTAFAEDKTAETYWTDKTNTSAEEAFQSLNNTVDYFLPSLLGIEINGSTIASLLGITDPDSASVSDVVKGASPLLMNVLGVAKADENQKKQIIMDHLGVDTYSGMYDKYFSYLNEDDAAISFFDLYQFCKDNKNSSNAGLKNWCNDTLAQLNVYLDLYDAAIAGISTTEAAYAKLSSAATLEKTKEKKYNGVAYKDLATGETGDVKPYTNGVEAANKFFEALGVDLQINDPAEALYYYYSPNAEAFVNGLIAVYLAKGNISSTKILPSGGSLTASNVMSVLEAALPDYQAAHPSDPISKADFIKNNVDIITTTGITYTDPDSGDDVTLEPVKDMTEQEAFDAGYYITVSGTNYAVPVTGWPVQVPASSLPPATDPAVKNDPRGAANSPLRFYFYINPATNKLVKQLKSNSMTTPYNNIAEPYYQAFLKANTEVDVVDAYGNMLKECYMDIASSNANLGVYRSSAYDIIIKNALKETEMYEDVDAAINEAKITDAQITAASTYFKENDLIKAEDMKNYLNSGDCAFSAEARNAMLVMTSSHMALVNALNGKDPSGTDSSTPVVDLFKAVSFNQSPYNLHGINTVVDVTNYSVSSVMLYNYIGSDKIGTSSTACDPGTKTANAPVIFKEIYKYNLVKGTLNDDKNKFHYADFSIPEEYAVDIVNNTINSYIDQFLDPGSEVGSIIDGVVGALLESDVDLHGTLRNIWKDLATNPIETLFNLLPTVVILLDEVLVPILFNEEGDAYNTMLYDLLSSGLIKDLTLESGNTQVGITKLSFDLNSMLPALLEWFKYNAGDDDSKAVAFSKAKAYVGTYADLGYDVITEESEGSQNIVKGKDVLAFTGIYVADRAIMGANLGTSMIRVLKNAGLDEQLATGINEILENVVDIADAAVVDYAQNQASNPDVRYTTSNVKATEGLNDIFVGLPQIIDGIGKELLKYFNVDSDWTYCFSGKLYSATDSNGHAVLRNKSLTDFKAEATSGKPDEILETFVNIFIGHQLNAFIDMFNDIFNDDNNDITKNVPLVQGLLNALGGLGETSIITDVVDAFFQLTRKDKPSFELIEREETKFVGFSTESGIYLIANLFSHIDKANEKNNKGIIPLVMSLIKKDGQSSQSSGAGTLGIDKKAAGGDSAPLLTLSSKNVNYKSLLTSQNKKQAEKLISKLDTLLSSLLKNTTINGFDLTATDNILSGVVSVVSNYIGENNTNALIDLVDKYLQTIVGDNDSSSTGKVDKNKVYTSAKLSTLVIETYSLIEGIIDYLLGSLDDNAIIAGAVKGVISPDAVGIRMSDDYNKTAKILLDKDYLTWADVKAKKSDLDFGFSKGNKTEFYNALGESLSGIAAILGVVLTASYTDAAKSGNFYSELVYPVMSELSKATGAGSVMSPSAFNSASASQQLIKGIVTPVSNILTQLYKAPASFLMNVVKGLAALLDDSMVKGVVNGALDPIKMVFTGVENLIATLSPTLAEYVKGIIDDAIVSKITLDLPEKNVIATLINNISIDDETKVSDYVYIESIDFKKVANAASPAEVLLIVYGYIVDNALKSDLVTGLLDSLSPQISAILKKFNAGQVLGLLNTVLSVVQSPTEVYWTFSEYAGHITNTFVYPRTITAQEAANAVSQLDTSVGAVFALLNDLNVTDIKGLNALINDKLYTNDLITTIAKAVYGALEKNKTIKDVLRTANLDLSPAGFAKYLTDKSYGKTYSSAAKTLKGCSSWAKVKKVNWGFKDGSSKAEAGFVNGIAALVRPVNRVLAVLLAEGDMLELKKADIDKVIDIIKNLDINETIPVADDSEFGATLKLTIKNGNLKLIIDSKNSSDNSTIKANLAQIAKDFLYTFANQGGFGTNGYESAVIPILEAFMCKNVKTYKQYVSDYKKAKDNLIIDILKPITGFIGDVAKTPFNTVTKVLPNVAYFIDSNGLTQAVGNLLAPVTAKNGLLGLLAKNGVDVDKIIKAITGKSLGKIVTDALDINVKLNLELGHLEKCNLQDIVYPLVNKLLTDKLGMRLPKFKFSTIASHGTIKVVKSAAKNDKGKYTTRRVVAKQGEVLVAVLRYVADTLIKNAKPIKKLLTNIDAIKKNKTIVKIINSVFAQLAMADKDDIVRAIFYLLTKEPTDNFFDYSNFKYKDGYEFSFGEMDEEFCRKLAPMLDGLVNGLLGDKGGLNGLIGDMLYKDELVSKLATGLYGAIEGVKLGKAGSLTGLLAHFDIDFSTYNVATLLSDKRYGQTYEENARKIRRAGSWKNIKPEDLKWGVKDRKSFEYALCAVLRPIYGVLDVFLNDSALNLANIASVPGSDCYTSTIVPLLEAFGCYNIKTQYQYREDMSHAYDAILLDVLDPLLDKVEDILYAPIEMLADMLPNLALFFANDGLLQIIDNLLTPVTALLEALRPIVDVNDILKALDFDLNKLTAKAGLNLGIKLDIYDLKSTLRPLIGADNVVGLLNKILGIIKIKGKGLGIELPNIDWYQLASHGELIKDQPSQAATIGARMFVQSDQDETLIAVLRFLIDTINYKGNYDAIVGLLGGLLGGLSDSIAGVIDQVLGMLKGDSDTVIQSLVELLQSIAG